MYSYEKFTNNKQMQVKWQAFLRKIMKDDKYVPFYDVITYIQTTLRPYWENLAQI